MLQSNRIRFGHPELAEVQFKVLPEVGIYRRRLRVRVPDKLSLASSFEIKLF
jgi:hypothetical protein